eukprot:gene16625-biopygen8875
MEIARVGAVPQRREAFASLQLADGAGLRAHCASGTPAGWHDETPEPRGFLLAGSKVVGGDSREDLGKTGHPKGAPERQGRREHRIQFLQTSYHTGRADYGHQTGKLDPEHPPAAAAGCAERRGSAKLTRSGGSAGWAA